MRAIHAVLTVLTLAAPLAASSAETLYVAGAGGSFQKIFEEKIIPAFERRPAPRSSTSPATPPTTLARMQRARRAGDRRRDLDDGPMYQAVALGLCANSKALRPTRTSIRSPT